MLTIIKKFLVKWIHKSIYKPGHYYSPIPDLNEIADREATIFKYAQKVEGVDLNVDEQLELLTSLKQWTENFDYPTSPEPSRRYYKSNIFFNESDGFMLHAMVLHFKPRRIIEIGSGFSSALMLDVNEKWMDNSIELAFIEPYPERLYSLLKSSDTTQVNVSKVQEVPLSFFEKLEDNDILFVDSSHVSKVGSDLNYIVFDIFPSLKKGVIIHFHDITWPFEYPKSWVMEGRFWNENYILRAFLMHNDSYKIVLYNHYIASQHRDWIGENLPLCLVPGGSLYIQKKN